MIVFDMVPIQPAGENTFMSLLLLVSPERVEM